MQVLRIAIKSYTKFFEKLYEVHKKTLSEESKKLALNNVFTEDLRAAAFETLEQHRYIVLPSWYWNVKYSAEYKSGYFTKMNLKKSEIRL